ncbi:prepilin-type N-terminal cleavage/methylation domain-containing protein [Arenimonas sp.]|uniref:prepilin-type N-terminal cleavage/methylation domain-containing protein n=1 Tax=Arenimonas sp. TaxID=1872635 RepID=UPI0035AFEAFA
MKTTRGFSLIEVLMATALLAAGLALAFAAVSNATRATTVAEEEARRAERLRGVQGFLRRQLEGALLLPMAVTNPGEPAPVFEASADELRFVSAMPGYLSHGGPHVQTLRLVRGGQGIRLEFEHALLTSEGPLEEDDRKPQVLLDGITEASFSVRSLRDDGTPDDWQDRWENVEQVPRLVRLELQFREPRARWPAFVVAPRLGASRPPGFAVGGPTSSEVPPAEPGR